MWNLSNIDECLWEAEPMGYYFIMLGSRIFKISLTLSRNCSNAVWHGVLLVKALTWKLRKKGLQERESTFLTAL